MSDFKDLLFGAIKYVAVLPLVYCLIVPIYRVTLHPLRKLPGPALASVTDLYAGYFVYQQVLHRQVLKNHTEYGPIVRHGPNRLVFNTVSALKTILQNPRVAKSHAYKLIGELHGYPNALDEVDKQVHRRFRRILGRGLSDSAVRTIQPGINDQIDILLRLVLEGAKGESALNVTPLVKRFMLDAMGIATFGYPLQTQTSERDRWLGEGLTIDNTLTNMFLNVPDLFKLRLHSLAHLLDPSFDKKFKDLITRLISMPRDDTPDLYTLIQDGASRDTETIVEESELVNQTFLLLAAGNDTISEAICATLFYLSRHARVYARLTEDIRSTFKSGKEIVAGSQLTGCQYLRLCIDETLRVSPPGGGVLWREQDAASRKAGESLIIDGHVIPPGTQFGIGIYALHHNENYFPSPFAYKPERWLASETPQEQLKLMHDAFVPFSLGSRACPGRAVAYTQISLVLAKFIWYFDFEVTHGQLGSVGARRVTVGAGRFEEEYDVSDIFVPKHDGPYLLFQPRPSVDELEK